MSGLKILYNLILKDTVKRSGSASGILSIGKDVRKLADKKFQRYVKSAQNQGVDLDKLSEQEAKYMLELNKPKEPVVLSNEDAYAFLNRFLNQGKKGEVIKGKFNKPFVKEISFVDDVINDINKMETITAMKEVNRVIGKQGRYRDLTKKEIDRIFKETEDRTAGRLDDIEPEDFAYGGVAGMLGERTGYQEGKTAKKSFIKLIPQYDEKGNLIPVFSKTGKQQIEGAPEGITSDKEVFNLIVGLDIPITEKINILGDIGFSKYRDKIEKGDEELFLMDPGGDVNKNIGIGYEDDGLSGSFTYNPDTKYKQFKISKKFNEGGKVGRPIDYASGGRVPMVFGGRTIGVLKNLLTKFKKSSGIPRGEKTLKSDKFAKNLMSKEDKLKLLQLETKYANSILEHLKADRQLFKQLQVNKEMKDKGLDFLMKHFVDTQAPHMKNYKNLADIDQAILELETLVKNKTLKEGRQLNASGGLAHMVGE